MEKATTKTTALVLLKFLGAYGALYWTLLIVALLGSIAVYLNVEGGTVYKMLCAGLFYFSVAVPAAYVGLRRLKYALDKATEDLKVSAP
jgi:hypothetical protein